MVADGSVGSASSALGFPSAWLGSETFLACCEMIRVDFVSRCDLGTDLYKKEMGSKMCIESRQI